MTEPAGTRSALAPSVSNESRVLLLPPTRRDAAAMERVLRSANIDCGICGDLHALVEDLRQGAGVAVVSEESVLESGGALVEFLRSQPVWSDVPVVVLSRAGAESPKLAMMLQALGSVSVLERPVRISTLISVIRTAMRARHRQYEVRDLLIREHAARAEAEAASLAKDQFLAALSHELRTPLNPVLMTVSALREDPQLPLEVREDLELIKRNIELESRLIDDLLDVTRIVRGKIELHQEALDLHTLIEQTARSSCHSDLLHKNIRLDMNLKADRPYVWGDAARLAQVFWNLVRNAVKFTPEHGQVCVETADAEDGMVEIAVCDSGIGIEGDRLDRIFDAFEQGDRAITRQFGGLGLGLAICKALVDLHGGTITAYSQGAGTGSRFAVRLRTVPEPPPAPSAATIPCLASVTLDVLLVEDHDSTARVMARLLGSMGHSVCVAGTLHEALQRLEHGSFGLIISDLGLPDGTGLDLIRQVRQSSRIPAIAISGYGMDEDVRQSHSAGFNDHLIKPIDTAKLQAALQRVLAG